MSEDAAAEIAALVRGYYRALEAGEALTPFYMTDAAAGPLGPVVKIGSGEGEQFVGWDATAEALARVTAELTRNRLQSRGLMVRHSGDVAWFFDLVWWSGEARGRPFGSLTRWTGVCLRAAGRWKLLQLHVSEGTPE